MFPGLDPRPVHSEACLYTMSPDGDFVLDRIDGVIVCGGYSGHAFKFGPLLGRLIADLAQGRPLPPEADRFRAIARLAVGVSLAATDCSGSARRERVGDRGARRAPRARSPPTSSAPSGG